MPALLLLSGPSAGLRFEVSKEATMGRSPSCEIPLEDSKVSRRHAKIEIVDGQARITDLGSRNGTVVNGERIEGEAILLPGDRLQVGDSTALFEPPIRASFAERDLPALERTLVEELLPAAGPEAAAFLSGVALLSATSEAMVLRVAAEELLRWVSAERAAALLGGSEGLLTAAVVGAETVEVPRQVALAALERRETSCGHGVLCSPLIASGGSPFGLLYAERAEPYSADEQRIAAVLGRMTGEAFAATRARLASSQADVQLIGGSRSFRKVVEQARRAAAADEPVVLHGEASTGRHLLARYIHTRSARALGPLVVVECDQGPVPVEEELFGRQSAPGVPPQSSALLRADGGTLVLRNVDSLQRQTAERLARFLSRRVAPGRQGGEERVSVRLIATCSAPVQVLAARGDLEQDLSRGLAGIEIELMPVRERRADVIALFEHFAAAVTQPLRREAPTLSPDAKRLMTEYAWPGNVREIALMAERLAILYAGSEIPALRLPPEVQEGTPSMKPRTLAQMIARLERDVISEALREARGKKIRAAALLGISRPTLDKKIEDYDLVVEKVRKT